MIIVKLSGGMGNQLFQYAAGKSLAIQNNTELGLDVSFYSKSPNRIFELDKFNINAKIVTPKELRTEFNIKKGFLSIFFANTSHTKNVYNEHIFSEKFFEYDPSFLMLKDPIVIDGYWQSELYFMNIVEEIRKEFTLKNPIRIQNKYLELLNSKCSVALHIRRGDYVSNAENNKMHGTCPDSYYLNALDQLKKKINEFVTFIFTDDVAEGNRLAKLIEGAIVVEEVSRNKVYHDFFFMQICNHAIIANSSFSWWAAWLNLNPQKLVYAPLNWFSDQSKNTKDLYPFNWNIL